jgi:hypothetical protein
LISIEHDHIADPAIAVTPARDFVIEVERRRETQWAREMHAGSIEPMRQAFTIVGIPA